MDRLSKLKEELAFLEKRLPQIKEAQELTRLAAEYEKQIALLRIEIRALEEKK
jgi:hypothetical protein